MKSMLARQQGTVKPNNADAVREEKEGIRMNKSFGFSKKLSSRYEVVEEIGEGILGILVLLSPKKMTLMDRRLPLKLYPRPRLCIYM
ncbi:hypothetical protein LguiB_031147 [Lonicera macranthoides]